MSELINRSCVACVKGGPALTLQRAAELLREIPGWELNSEIQTITRTLRFKNYYETMAFVNMVAWIAHSQDHHPDLKVSYNRCVVRFSTHAVEGLSENDFICAAKINALLAATPNQS